MKSEWQRTERAQRQPTGRGISLAHMKTKKKKKREETTTTKLMRKKKKVMRKGMMKKRKKEMKMKGMRMEL